MDQGIPTRPCGSTNNAKGGSKNNSLGDEVSPMSPTKRSVINGSPRRGRVGTWGIRCTGVPLSVVTTVAIMSGIFFSTRNLECTLRPSSPSMLYIDNVPAVVGGNVAGRSFETAAQTTDAESDDAEASEERRSRSSDKHEEGLEPHMSTTGIPSTSDPLSEDDRGQSPRVAWLMSFPNSGTSFTMRLIQRSTNRTAASNYGYECEVDEKEKTNIPLFPELSPGGPFLLSPNTRPLPEHYIMTKTHCGGRCTDCAPRRYIETKSSFLDMCLKGSRRARPNEAAEVKKGGSLDYVVSKYEAKLVKRAVHLIRNPFNNIVSRFHLEQHEHAKVNSSDAKRWLETFPETPEGFQRWCKYLDKAYMQDEADSRYIDDETVAAFWEVPCHAEFFRFVNWHNLAIDVTRSLQLPTLVIHYENYETQFDVEQDRLLNFLKLPREGDKAFRFIGGKRYEEEYFTLEQRRAAMKLVQQISEPTTWTLLQRYEAAVDMDDSSPKKAVKTVKTAKKNSVVKPAEQS